MAAPIDPHQQAGSAPLLAQMAPGVVASNAPPSPSLYPGGMPQYYFAAPSGAGAAPGYAPVQYVAMPPTLDGATPLPQGMPVAAAAPDASGTTVIEPAAVLYAGAATDPVEDTLWKTKITVRNAELLAGLLLIMYLVLIGFWPVVFYLPAPLLGFLAVRERVNQCTPKRQLRLLVSYVVIKSMLFITYAVLLGIIMGDLWATNRFFWGLTGTVTYILFVVSQVMGLHAARLRIWTLKTKLGVSCCGAPAAGAPAAASAAISTDPEAGLIRNAEPSGTQQLPYAMPVAAPAPYPVSMLPAGATPMPYASPVTYPTAAAAGAPAPYAPVQMVYHPAIGQMVPIALPPGTVAAAGQAPAGTYPGAL